MNLEQKILLLVILMVAIILIATKEEDCYMDYRCYDRTLWKCLNCKKRCNYHLLAKKLEESKSEAANENE